MDAILRMSGLLWVGLMIYYMASTVRPSGPDTAILSTLILCAPGLILIGIGELLHKLKAKQ